MNADKTGINANKIGIISALVAKRVTGNEARHATNDRRPSLAVKNGDL